MSGLVTTPPIMIDPAFFSRIARTADSTGWSDPVCGPFPVGSSWYAFLQRNDGCPASGIDARIGIWKSTDDGATWVLQDSANSPPDLLFADIPRFNPISGIIEVAYVDLVTATTVLYGFDTATDLWGSPSASTGGAPGTTGSHGLELARLSNGDFFVFFAPGAGTGLFYRKFSGGTWGAATNIDAAGRHINAVLVDSSDRIHIAYIRTGTVLRYLQMDGAGTTSGGATLITGASSVPVGAMQIIGTSLYIPWVDNQIGGTPNVSVGTPLNAPVFTTVQVSADATSASVHQDYCNTALDSTGQLVYFWTEVNVSDGSILDVVNMAKFNGATFDPQTVFYDANTNPPATGVSASGQFIHTISVANQRVSDSVWFAIVAMETSEPDGCNPDGTVHCSGFLLVTPAAGSPTAVCPTAIPKFGIPFNTTIQVIGGTAPFTFALIAGALPTGLSLNTSTGVISGTPTAFGVFSYTILITDANGKTVTITCSFTVRDPTRTLRWQCPAPGRAGRWFPHVYADPVITHYLVEPNAAFPNDQELFMLAGGAILQSGGNTDAGADIVVIAEPGSIDNGDERAQKLYVDAMTEADQVGPISAQIRFNNSQQTGPTLLMNPAGPRQQFLENIASLMDLSLYRNISVRYTWTGGPDGPRIYAFEPSGYAMPYVSTRFVTQYINLSFPAWKSHRRLYPALISNADVIFTIETQDNRVFTTVIPSTGGQFRIIPLIVAHGCKQLAFAYQLDGQGTPFALFPDAFTIETKAWTEESYVELAIFKT